MNSRTLFLVSISFFLVSCGAPAQQDESLYPKPKQPAAVGNQLPRESSRKALGEYVLVQTGDAGPFALTSVDRTLLVSDLGVLLHQQIPEKDATGVTRFEDLSYASFQLVGAPAGTGNVYFIVEPTGPSDDPFRYFLVRLSVATKTFTLMQTSSLFGLQYSPQWKTTPDAAALVWIPRGPDGGELREGRSVYEPRKIYLIDLESDTSKAIVSLTEPETLNAIAPCQYNNPYMRESISADGVLEYAVYSAKARSEHWPDPCEYLDPSDPRSHTVFRQELVDLRTVETEHGKQR